MEKIALLTAGGFLFVFLCWLCVVQTAGPMQQDLQLRSADALIAAGIPSAGLSIDGRDAVITGLAGSPQMSDRARAVLEGVRGVRAVRHKILVTKAKE